MKLQKHHIQEFLYQIVIHVVLFVFYAFDRHGESCSEQQFAFFMNYIVAAGFINYLLVPIYLYNKQYIKFGIGLVFTITWVILIEELYLEHVYFPGTRRAKVFNDVFHCLLDVLPIITILVGFKFAWDAHWNRKKIEQLSQLMQESELQFLKTQINPHFLFNNLNNIYAFAVEQSPKTPDIILELSSVLRYMLYESQDKEVVLAKDVKHLRDYTNLNTYQFDNRGVVKFNEEGHLGSVVIAPHLLVMFVENAFKHSSSSILNDVFIEIDIKLEDDGTFIFKCKNSFQEESNVQQLSEGIGLANVKKRLQLLYPNAHKLDIKTEENLYSVDLKIKLNPIK